MQTKNQISYRTLVGCYDQDFVRTIDIHSQRLLSPVLYWIELSDMHRPSSSGFHLGPQVDGSMCEKNSYHCYGSISKTVNKGKSTKLMNQATGSSGRLDLVLRLCSSWLSTVFFVVKCRLKEVALLAGHTMSRILFMPFLHFEAVVCQ